MRILLTSIGFFFFLSNIGAQITFERTYQDTNSFRSGKTVMQDANGDYIIGGMIYDSIADNRSIILYKTDEYGNQIWQRTYNWSDMDVIFQLLETSTNGYLLSGYTEGFGANTRSAFLMEIDDLGDSVWAKIYSDTCSIRAYDMKFTNDNALILSGIITWGYYFHRASWLQKVDLSGNIIWTSVIYDTLWSGARDVQQTADSGFIYSGMQYIPNNPYTTPRLTKVDKLGNVQWMRTYPGSDSAEYYINALIRTADEGYVYFGHNRESWPNHDDQHIFIRKHNDNGELLWAKEYDMGKTQELYSARSTPDNGFVMTGYLTENDSTYCMYVLKTDENGDSLWIEKFYTGYYSVGHDVNNTSDNGFIITGLQWKHGAIYLVKTDGYGNIVGIEKGEVDDEELFRIYPNPAGDRIKIATVKTCKMTISIIDMNGQAIMKRRLDSGSAAWIDISHLNSGVYLMSVNSEEISEVRRFIKY